MHKDRAVHSPGQDLHLHSDYSDSIATVSQLVERAARVGLGVIAITDHFWPSLGSRKEGIDLIISRRQLIEEARQESPSVTVLDGAEIDVALDGSLAPVAGGLEQFDLIIASVHFKCDSSTWASAIVKLLRNNAPHILGHWDANLTSYNAEDGERVASALAEKMVAVELSLRYPSQHDEFLQAARDQGCLFSLGSDSHTANTVGQLHEQEKLADVLGLPLLNPLKRRRHE